MDTQNQLVYFLLSVLIGLVGGVLYEIFALFRLLLGCDKGKCKKLGFALDVVFGASFGFFCVFASYFCHFPDFRGYMGVGFAIGLIIYIKILQIILAFFKKVCYNGITSMVKRAKIRKKTLK